MSLFDAKAIGGETPLLPKGPPYLCRELLDWAGVSFWMPPGDPRLEDINRGEKAPSPPLENLSGMIRYWKEHPEWMDMLNPDSPVHRDKITERALYLDFWENEIDPGSHVLDLGGGVGRMTEWLLSLECDVELVDPDLRSLWRAVHAAAGRPGRIDVHWSTGEHLPDLGVLDAVIACEVLNYVEEPDKIIENVRRQLKPGGKLLLSVEARWGWAMSSDVAEGSIDSFFSDGIVHIPGDRWIRTYDETQIRSLLRQFKIVKIQPSHYAFSGPFEMAAGPMDPQKAIELENRLRSHPVASGLNRAWMVIAEKMESME